MSVCAATAAENIQVFLFVGHKHWGGRVIRWNFRSFICIFVEFASTVWIMGQLSVTHATHDAKSFRSDFSEWLLQIERHHASVSISTFDLFPVTLMTLNRSI